MDNDTSVLVFLLILVGLVVVGGIVFTLVYAAADKSQEIAKNIKIRIEQKRLNNELNQIIESNIKEFQEFRSSFQFFSDEKLLILYQQFQDSNQSSNMEQLALEEELVKRKLITHSPMHEKIYAIKKEIYQN